MVMTTVALTYSGWLRLLKKCSGAPGSIDPSSADLMNAPLNRPQMFTKKGSPPSLRRSYP
jgi:hypothetical protein